MVSVAAGAGAAAHPRVSGENHHDPVCTYYSTGSSPRERGKHGLNLQRGGHTRLIPA